MRIGAIIFSRMSSSRLPGKAFIDISGEFLLERVIDRTKKINLIDHICIATSTRKEDDKISLYAESRGLDVFRGSLDDVALRALNASKKYNYDSFLRVCGDRPFLDYKIYDKMIATHKKNDYDLTTNIFPRTVPPGLTGEIVNVKSLQNILKLTNNANDREHITRFFYRNSDQFKINNCNFFTDKNILDLRLVIDDSVDLERSKWIISNMKNNNQRTNELNQVIELAKKWEINKNNNL